MFVLVTVMEYDKRSLICSIYSIAVVLSPMAPDVRDMSTIPKCKFIYKSLAKTVRKRLIEYIFFLFY